MASATSRHLRGLVVAAAVVAIASLAYGDPIELTDGVPIAGLSGGDGSEVHYKIVVPNGQGELEISISGGTGDCDLYVRYGGAPDYTMYDYRPFLFGNNETVTAANPAAGSWYIMLRGRHAYSGVTLVASYTPAVPTELDNGVPLTGRSGSRHTQKLYSIDVPAGQASLEVATWGGTGDVDLYVKHGSAPGLFDFDGRSFNSGTEETVTIGSPAAGTWYIMLDSSPQYNNVTLRAVYGSAGPASDILDDVMIPNLSGAAGSETLFVINSPSGPGGLDFRIFGGTGNCDMYIKKGVRPTLSDWDFKPTAPGNSESIFVTTDDMHGPWYVLLVGAEAYSGVTLTVHFVPLPQPPEEPDQSGSVSSRSLGMSLP